MEHGDPALREAVAAARREIEETEGTRSMLAEEGCSPEELAGLTAELVAKRSELGELEVQVFSTVESGHCPNTLKSDVCPRPTTGGGGRAAGGAGGRNGGASGGAPPGRRDVRASPRAADLPPRSAQG